MYPFYPALCILQSKKKHLKKTEMYNILIITLINVLNYPEYVMMCNEIFICNFVINGQHFCYLMNTQDRTS